MLDGPEQWPTSCWLARAARCNIAGRSPGIRCSPGPRHVGRLGMPFHCCAACMLVHLPGVESKICCMKQCLHCYRSCLLRTCRSRSHGQFLEPCVNLWQCVLYACCIGQRHILAPGHELGGHHSPPSISRGQYHLRVVPCTAYFSTHRLGSLSAVTNHSFGMSDL